MKYSLPTIYKNKDIIILEECGKINKEILQLLRDNCVVGNNILDLDRIAEEYIKSKGAEPACLMYNNFPKNLCISIDDVIVHGIPKDVTIKEGMIINIDCPVKYKDFYTDATINVCVGKVNEEKNKLNEYAYSCLMDTISFIKPNIKIGDICKHQENFILCGGYKTIKEFRSHGVGNNLHEPPYIPHYYDKKNPYNDYKVREGNVFTIEPIVVTNTTLIKLNDGWGYKTKDSSFGTYWEHTVLITNNGNKILT